MRFKAVIPAASSILLIEAALLSADVTFRKHVIDPQFRAEAITAGDINRDGKLDIVAGESWYEAPTWKPHKFREVKMEGGYADVRFDAPEDINGDGWVDLATCHRGPLLEWLENPKGEARLWPAHKVGESVSTEPVIYVDLDNDGKGEFVGPTEWSKKRGCLIGWWKRGADPTQPWQMTTLTERPCGCGHGIAVGDITRDGQLELLADRGYYEIQPNPQAEKWKFRPLERSLTHQAVVYDFDGDGDADVAGSCPHDYGIYWYEQVPGPEGRRAWWRHTIDETISQLHALAGADIDGDGDLDLVTGKRYKAHEQGDPGTDDPALLVWYELSRSNGQATFTRHVIDDDSGAGYVVTPIDIDGDGHLDILAANKKGVFLFEQVGKPVLLPLFDGKTLDNWSGDKTVWRVEDGAIVGHTDTGLKKNTFLCSRDQYDDFVLTLDVKLVPDNANSGIQFRSRPREDGECVGYQADIGQEYWGSIYEEQGRGMLQSGFKDRAERTRIKEAWNHYVVHAVGNHLRVEINGTVCADIRDDKAASGVIALQVHSGGPTDVRFKNIRLRKMERSR